MGNRKNRALSTSAIMLAAALSLTACAADNDDQPSNDQNATASESEVSSAPTSSESEGSSTPSASENKKEDNNDDHKHDDDHGDDINTVEKINVNTPGDQAMKTAVEKFNKASYVELTAETDGNKDRLKLFIDRKNDKIKVDMPDPMNPDETSEVIQDGKKVYMKASKYIADSSNGKVKAGEWLFTSLNEGDQSLFDISDELLDPNSDDYEKFKNVKGVEEELDGMKTIKYQQKDEITMWINAETSELYKIKGNDDNEPIVTIKEMNADKTIDVPKNAVDMETIMPAAVEDDSVDDMKDHAEDSADGGN